MQMCLISHHRRHPSVEQEYQQSDLVFVGRVTAAKAVPEAKPFDEGTRYKIQVKKTFRGRPGHTLTVFSENSSGRFPMNIGVDYLVFLSPSRVLKNSGLAPAVLVS